MVVNPYRNSGIRTPYAPGGAVIGGKSTGCSCIPTRWLILVLVISITVISYFFHISHGLALEAKHVEPSPKLRGDQSHYRKPRIGSHTTTDGPTTLPTAPDQDKSKAVNINIEKAAVSPSFKPSPSPTSEKPTHGPTPPPRLWPTILPTPLPTVAPTLIPSVPPSAVPIAAPTLKATEQAQLLVTAKTTTDSPAATTSTTSNPGGEKELESVESKAATESAVPPLQQVTNLEVPPSIAIVNHNQPPQTNTVKEAISVTNKQGVLVPSEPVQGENPHIRPLSLPEADAQQPEHVLTPPKEVTVAHQQQISIAPPASPAANVVEAVSTSPQNGEHMISVEEAAAGEIRRSDLTNIRNEPVEQQQQRSRFDLPASVKVVYPGRPLVKANSNNTTNAADGSKPKIDYCQGHTDPFEEQSIENFTPPPSATFDKVVEWKSTVKETLKGIGKLQIGGDKLRKIMEQEVDKLKILRFKLFCEYAT